jgi:hypothetical protein
LQEIKAQSGRGAGNSQIRENRPEGVALVHHALLKAKDKVEKPFQGKET